jgi:hypothetical protein
MAVTVAAVAVLALLGGGASRRAGFCGSLRPVLPVETVRAAPILPLQGARCTDCVRCMNVGCIDLAGSKAVPQTIGSLRRDTGWLRTSFGVFAAAFPGFIFGYFTTVNGDLSSAVQVYTRILTFAAASYGIVALVTLALSVRATVAMSVLGATSLGVYYWFAAPNLTEAYHAPSVTTWAVRIMGLCWRGGYRLRNAALVRCRRSETLRAWSTRPDTRPGPWQHRYEAFGQPQRCGVQPPCLGG